MGRFQSYQFRAARDVNDMVRTHFGGSFGLMLKCFHDCDPQKESKILKLTAWNVLQISVGQTLHEIVKKKFESFENFLLCYTECGFLEPPTSPLTPPVTPSPPVSDSSFNEGHSKTNKGTGSVTGASSVHEDDEEVTILYHKNQSTAEDRHFSFSSNSTASDQPSTSGSQKGKRCKFPRKRHASVPAEQPKATPRTRHIFTPTQDLLLREILNGEATIQGVGLKEATLKTGMIPIITDEVNRATCSEMGPVDMDKDLLTEKQVADWYRNRKIKVPKGPCPLGFRERLPAARNRAYEQLPNIANPLPTRMAYCRNQANQPREPPNSASRANSLEAANSPQQQQAISPSTEEDDDDDAAQSPSKMSKEE